jgi:hypothetical protein
MEMERQLQEPPSDVGLPRSPSSVTSTERYAGRGRQKRHTWWFSATTVGQDAERWPVAIAICVECGTIRSQDIDGQRDAGLDLRGQCAGQPEA